MRRTRYHAAARRAARQRAAMRPALLPLALGLGAIGSYFAFLFWSGYQDGPMPSVMPDSGERFALAMIVVGVLAVASLALALAAAWEARP